MHDKKHYTTTFIDITLAIYKLHKYVLSNKAAPSKSTHASYELPCF